MPSALARLIDDAGYAAEQSDEADHHDARNDVVLVQRELEFRSVGVSELKW